MGGGRSRGLRKEDEGGRDEREAGQASHPKNTVGQKSNSDHIYALPNTTERIHENCMQNSKSGANFIKHNIVGQSQGHISSKP